MQPKILAVASKGGHWEQMMLLRPAFEGGDVTFAGTDPQQKDGFAAQNFICLSDYSRTRPLDVLRGFVEVYRIVSALRPNVVISTGAAPGLLAIVWGKLLGSRTIWVDSIANSQKLSLSGSMARKIADVTLTQWEHLSSGDECRYWGAVI